MSVPSLDAPSIPETTGVLIIGGGPVGLTASVLLSMQGIDNVVVERRRNTQAAPAAHVLRPRPMEVLARIGVTDEIEKRVPPLDLDYIVFCASLGGTEIGRLDARKDLPEGEEIWTNCSQNILEPILLERALCESAAQILTGAECIAVDQDEQSVRAVVRAHDGSEHTLEARWMIGADGAGSSVRHMLDIPMIGPGPQGRFCMVHFQADLRPLMKGRSGPLYWILNPESTGVIIVHDPAGSCVFMTLMRGTEHEEREVPARLEAAIGADIPHRIISTDAWSPHVQVAERYREGRVFLAGDAAHRFPPTGGLGLNTGILDVETLVHQLTRVEAGADPAILDDYEALCRPAAQTNADESFANMQRLGEIFAVLGPVDSLAALEQRVASLTPDERSALDAAIENQRSHFLSEGRLPDRPHEGD